MGILDYMRQKKHMNQYVSEITEAEQMFIAQKEAIKSLESSKGLKEIVAYWERQMEINENMFEKSKEDKDKYFALYKQPKMFLQFIANLLD